MAIAFPRGERTLGTRLHSLALSEPSQAFTMKALLRFCFILFVYLFVYYYNNYFWLGWWRGGGGGGKVGFSRAPSDSNQREKKNS